MPKIPDHIVEEMNTRPEYASEEASARHFLKVLGVNKSGRDKVKKWLRKESKIEAPDDTDVLFAVLDGAYLSLGSRRLHARGVSCLTMAFGESPAEAAASQVNDYHRTRVQMVLYRRVAHTQVRCISLLPNNEVPFLAPPFQVYESAFNNVWWVDQELPGLVRSLDGTEAAKTFVENLFT